MSNLTHSFVSHILAAVREREREKKGEVDFLFCKHLRGTLNGVWYVNVWVIHIGYRCGVQAGRHCVLFFLLLFFHAMQNEKGRRQKKNKQKKFIFDMHIAFYVFLASTFARLVASLASANASRFSFDSIRIDWLEHFLANASRALRKMPTWIVYYHPNGITIVYSSIRQQIESKETPRFLLRNQLPYCCCWFPFHFHFK